MQQPQLLQDFRTHFSNVNHKHYHEGIDSTGSRQRFICRESLNDYWIKHVGKLLDGIHVTKEVLLESYLRVWSILCYIAESHELHYFNSLLRFAVDDDALPVTLGSWPSSFPTDPLSQTFRDKFLENQWLFVPLEFGQKTIFRRVISGRQIIPVKEHTPLGRTGGESSVYRVDLWPCCVSSKKYPPTVSFKKLGPTPDDTAYQLWNNELLCYDDLERGDSDAVSNDGMEFVVSSPFDYIIRRLGSFQQEGDGETVFTIILELASEGNLNDFCETKESVINPRREPNVLLFWDKLIRCLLQGLVAIHAANRTHQDIKESNIVVMEDPAEVQGPPWMFKFIDFDKSASRPDRDGNFTNNDGNRTYMAPECCKEDPISHTSPPPYTQKADIWSLGCLLSNLFVQSTTGKAGCADYQKRRKKENDWERSEKLGYEKGFHKSQRERLKCVEDMHREVLKNVNGNRNLQALEAVSRIVLDHMLQPDPEKRQTARLLLSTWKEYTRELSSVRPSQPLLLESSIPNPGPTRPSHDHPTPDPDDIPGEQANSLRMQPNLEIQLPPPPPLKPPLGTRVRVTGDELGEKSNLPAPQNGARSLPLDAKVATTGDALGPSGKQVNLTPVTPTLEVQRSPPDARARVTVKEFVKWHNSKSKKKKPLPDQFPDLHQELNDVGTFSPRPRGPLARGPLKSRFLSHKDAHFQGRSHWILVDDFHGTNIDCAANTVQAIVKLVKHRAPEGGVRLFFLSDHKKYHQNSKSKKLAELVRTKMTRNREARMLNGKSGICLWLTDVLEEAKTNAPPRGKPNPPNLYILTNGVFPGDPPNITESIDETGLISAKRLSIAFVQVGDDDAQRSGERALRQVWEEIRKIVKQLNCHPMHIHNMDDHVGNMIMSRIRAGSLSPSVTDPQPSIDMKMDTKMGSG